MTARVPVGLVLLAYFLTYWPFAAMLKSLADPLGALPTSLIGGSIAWTLYLALSGDWRLLRGGAMRDPMAWVAALGSVAILSSASVAYGLRGVSLVLPALLMKGGVLLMAPVLDAIRGGRPTRRQIVVLLMVMAAVCCGALHRVAIDGTAAALCCAAVYLAGYAVKLRAIDDRRGMWGFFCAESTITLLVALPVSYIACKVVGVEPSQRPLALLAGIASQGCCAFGSLILMRVVTPRHAIARNVYGLPYVPRSGSTLAPVGPAAPRASQARSTRIAAHTHLVPANRCASLLASMCAQVGLAAWTGGVSGAWASLSVGEVVGAGLMLGALWTGYRRV